MVTFVGTGSLNANGCWDHDQPVDSFTYVGYIPASARAGCTDGNTCGDMNWSIVQPDGTTIAIYGCSPAPNTDFQGGEVIGSGDNVTVCTGGVSGMYRANVLTDLGINGAATSGPNYDVELTHYNELAVPG